MLFNRKQESFTQTDSTAIGNLTPKTEPSTNPVDIDIKATFEIYTLGTKRVFTSNMYHNLDNDVYISSDDPSVVHVKRSGTTWADFFETLPMELTKDCLTTGTSQTFCTNDDYELKFFINDNQNPNALDEEINNDDELTVLYE
jgi:hypothetical protein